MRCSVFCREHNQLEDYEPFFEKWTDEEAANIAITLCRMVDKMMVTYQKKKEEEFVTEGGIRERMHQARTGYRRLQEERLAELENLVPLLEQQLAQARAAYEDLKQRAMKAYYMQQEEIETLKKKLEE